MSRQVKRARSPWRRRIGIALLVTTPLLAVVLYKRAERFVERDPAFCALCHEHKREFDLWTDSAHRKIRCQSCHHETSRERLSMLVSYVFRGPPRAAPPAIDGSGNGSGSGSDPRARARAHARKPAVIIDACQSCHARHDADWRQTRQSAGHRTHLGARAAQKGVTCVSCHVRSAHRLTDPLQSCRDCHALATREGDKMQRLHCNACHEFLGAHKSLRPTQSTCVDCHRSRNVATAAMRPHGAMGQFNCSNCHRPHAKAGARTVACGTCHEQIKTYGLHGNSEHGSCKSCHAPHGWTPTAARCQSCHEDVKHQQAPPKDKACWSCHSFARSAAPAAPRPKPQQAPR